MNKLDQLNSLLGRTEVLEARKESDIRASILDDLRDVSKKLAQAFKNHEPMGDILKLFKKILKELERRGNAGE